MDKLDIGYVAAVLAATRGLIAIISVMTSAAIFGAKSQAQASVAGAFAYGLLVLGYIVANEADDSQP